MDSGLVFPLLVAGRLLLAFNIPPDTLKYDQQLSSPLTSHLRLQEGIFLYLNNIDPYSGGVFYQSPLFLSLFSTILPTSRVACSILWTLCDAIGALALVRIWRFRQRVASSTRDGLIAALYLLNPYLSLPAFALSTSTIDNTLTLLTLMFASQGKKSLSLLTLAFVIQLSLSSILLLVPIFMLLLSGPVSHLASPHPFSFSAKRVLPLLIEFITYSIVLMIASTTVSGSWAWIPKTWGVSLGLPDLTPNPGLWWYFFTEMFDHFRPFFLMVFSVHLIIYIFPICIKFQHDPLYAAFLLTGVLGTFKAYLTLSDPGLFLSMMPLFPEIYPYLAHPIVTGLLHLHASLLLPLFHHLWISQGTGNANFFYASTLVFGMANGAALVDCTWAGLRIAIGRNKEGYEVVQE
ncbi:hypothetical protein SERLA73DRAFT_52780 [Serpula lacrymans var. lacrymans S7.3]|uniref:PIG-U-domain-containing protein n=2 Tax=Serpula lacrymans var. lacrymans TaxID=341189 RepID=F8PWM2_SERL3|nr:uncharacterized protein SERLADRAFT_369266 [Serpula lacrymans var. lacrymans S7.9]EGO00346.1 hypothetical protein SERLA73DRAFT_52780 [Serpula lacrymans var. lacrymans S7.3]EGO25907.1 hypothetical protein SERLADRAFT_369266 [Serpula lacrymans var. lacrymans S7.9]